MNHDNQLLEEIERSIGSLRMSSAVPGLYSPITYTLSSGGKRLRPLLCMRACEAFGHDPLDALNQAMAIEMFHNFTLIHDDVMDGSNVRRGRPTVFAMNGSTQAILSGDALLTLATRWVADCHQEILPHVLNLFNNTALEVYEGQQLDMEFENRDDVTTDEYLEMIRLKTSVLLGCACAMGAIVGRASQSDVEAVYTYGEKLGLAFQLRDDWLDTFGDPAVFGKAIGGDIRNRKKTWLFITATSEAPSEMAAALNGGESRIVPEVTAVYESLNLSERCNRLIDYYCGQAIKALESSSMHENARKWFDALARSLNQRTR